MGASSSSDSPNHLDISKIDPPSFVKLSTFWNATSLTTPESQGKALSLNTTDGTLDLESVDDQGNALLNQLWRLSGDMANSCYETESSSDVWTPWTVYNGKRFVATDSSHTPNTFLVTTGDGEQNVYNENTGVWCHWNCNGRCKNWTKTVKDPNAVCASKGSGVHGVPRGTNPENVPACRWITMNDAYKCCMLPPEMADKGQIYGPQCYPSYTPNSTGGTCPDIMPYYCSGYWTKTDESNAACEKYFTQYLLNYNDVKKVAHDVVFNFIHNQSPQGYVEARDGTSGTPNYNFFTKVVPKLGAIHNPTLVEPGPLDDILKYYCRGYTRDDVIADPVLQVLCGCHLLGLNETPNSIPVPRQNHKPNICLDIPVTDNTLTNQYPYTTVECDPVCNFSNVIQNHARKDCKQTECILDHINVNQFNSQGDVKIGVACGNCNKTGQTGGCNCFISQVDVNQINSNGHVEIDQNCGNCFTFTDDVSKAVPVDCGSLKPTPSGGGGVSKWVAVGVLVGVVVLTLIGLGLYVGFSWDSSGIPKSQPSTSAKMTNWYIVGGVIGTVVIAAIIGGVAIWWFYFRKPSPPGPPTPPCGTWPPPINEVLKDGWRLWGNGGGPWQPNIKSPQECYKNCKCTQKGMTGFSYFKPTGGCWCDAPPYADPQWTQTSDWISGQFG
jgi:hypothetical protein